MQTSKLTPLSEDQVQNIAKALADPRRYEIIKRISRSAQPLACESVRGCLEITAPTLSHHMKELKLVINKFPGTLHGNQAGDFQLFHVPRDHCANAFASHERVGSRRPDYREAFREIY